MSAREFLTDPAGHSGIVEQEIAERSRSGSVGQVSFLARGEYTLNFVAVVDERRSVVRFVTGSQMGLTLSEQVAYEARSLDLLSPSGRTPRLIDVRPEPERLPYPWMLIEFLSGRPLTYGGDLVEAAMCVAGIHRLGVPGDHGLAVQADPRPAISSEAARMAQPYIESRGDSSPEGRALAGFGSRVSAALKRHASVFAEPDLAIVNTDLNTHNFVVDAAGRASLLDWEKARIGPTTLDLAHFLLPTTTLWRESSAARLTADQERRFLDAYFEGRPGLARERYREQLRVTKALVAWRAIAWCAWALRAAATGEKAISNEETLRQCRLFTSPVFLDGLLDELEI